MSDLDSAVKDLIQAFKEFNKNSTSPYDTQAEVKRVEGDIAWVHIPGGVDETPVRMTVNAEVGDNVQVRVFSGDAFLVGNGTAPPTNDKKANQALANIKVVSDVADAAFMTLDEMRGAAQEAGTTLTQIYQDAVDAKESAGEAQESATQAAEAASEASTAAEDAKTNANIAQQSAETAVTQLSIIENVVGVLDLLSKHGTYTQITDTDAVAENGKWYFTRSGAGTTTNPYTYAVANLNVGDSVTGYYELTDIDEAITNYVSSHLALTDDGLSLQQDGSDYRLLISTDGLKIIGANGAIVASYGTETTIGSATGFNVKITGSELGFYQGAQRVAYINNNQLYITQSVVLQQMDLGIPVANGGLGQWSWKVHPNAQSPSRNNLNLKWIG